MNVYSVNCFHMNVYSVNCFHIMYIQINQIMYVEYNCDYSALFGHCDWLIKYLISYPTHQGESSFLETPPTNNALVGFCDFLVGIHQKFIIQGALSVIYILIIIL